MTVLGLNLFDFFHCGRWFWKSNICFIIFPLLNQQLHEPPYAASVHFELYKNGDDKYYIQIFYRRFDEEHPLALNIPACGRKCSFEIFKELYDEIIPGDFELECKWQKYSNTNWLQNVFYFKINKYWLSIGDAEISIEDKCSRQLHTIHYVQSQLSCVAHIVYWNWTKTFFPE